ncbi:protein c1orf9-like protein, partial [Lasius niger]
RLQESKSARFKKKLNTPDLKTLSRTIDGSVNGGAANGLIEESDESKSSNYAYVQQKREDYTGLKKKWISETGQATPGDPGRGMKKRKRHEDYASPDCGAKIVAANPEASSAKNILMSTRDEYMLNAGISRVWFVVKLCKAIQAKKIELWQISSSSVHRRKISSFIELEVLEAETENQILQETSTKDDDDENSDEEERTVG